MDFELGSFIGTCTPCSQGARWLEEASSPEEAWNHCPRVDWLFWAVEAVDHYRQKVNEDKECLSPETLHRLVEFLFTVVEEELPRMVLYQTQMKKVHPRLQRFFQSLQKYWKEEGRQMNIKRLRTWCRKLCDNFCGTEHYRILNTLGCLLDIVCKTNLWDLSQALRFCSYVYEDNNTGTPRTQAGKDFHDRWSARFRETFTRPSWP